MEIEANATALLERINNGIGVGELFMKLYAFIDNSSTGRFGWLELGKGAVYGVDCEALVAKHSESIRKFIDSDQDLPSSFDFCELHAALDDVIAKGTIIPPTSKKLVIALRVLDRAFLGVHVAEAFSKRDSAAMVRLRTGLRMGKPLFKLGTLCAFPKPKRLAMPEIRGQSSLSELLDVLTVMHESAHLEVEYQARIDCCSPASDDFLKIGVIPTINRREELTWTCVGDDRYAISESAYSLASVLGRVVTALDRLVDAGATMVLMPELVSGPSLHAALVAELSKRALAGKKNPVLLLAGTQHRLGGGSEHRNRAHVLNSIGTEMWFQDKMHAYCFTGGEQVASGCPLGKDDIVDRTEAISVEPRILRIVDISSAHRVAVLTCQDFSEDRPHRQAIVDLNATLLLVPIMAVSRPKPPNQGWISDAAMEYIRLSGATSVMANSGTLVQAIHVEREPWHFIEVMGSPRVIPSWISLPDPLGGPPIAWLASLNRRV